MNREIGIIGSGARESAFIAALLTDPQVSLVHVFGKNGGFAGNERVRFTGVTAPEEIVNYAVAHALALVVSGPERGAIDGTNDSLRAKDIPVFGATQKSIRIESDKAWAREVMQKLRIPQPKFEVHTQAADALAAAKTNDKFRVVKAHGPAEGKGVIVCDTEEQTIEAIEMMLNKNAFGAAGQKIVLEERLGWNDPQARESSIMYFTDGTSLIPLPPVQDYKREFDNDLGKNTGSMGCHTAPESLDREEKWLVLSTIAQPLIQELARINNIFVGILYISLMKTSQGIFVIEINGRGGDPETVVQFAGMKHPHFADFLLACALGNLGEVESPTWDSNEYVDVVLCAKSYPDGKSKGENITGMKVAEEIAHTIFHAGTNISEGRLTTNGGRILNVVGKGKTRQEARIQAYAAASQIRFDGQPPKFRSDIGK